MSQNLGGSYKDSPEWIKNNKKTTKPINIEDKKLFQYIVTVAWNCVEMKMI